MEHFIYDKSGNGLSHEEIKEALLVSLEGRALKNVLIIPPDFTRFHSNAGFITNVYYHIPDFIFFLCSVWVMLVL